MVSVGTRIGSRCRLARRLAGLLWLGLLPAACGSVTRATSDGGTGGAAGGTGGTKDAAMESVPPTVDQACNQYATSVCTALGKCGPLALQLFYGDSATCIARQKLSCTTDQSASGINRTTTEIETCAAAVSGASCSDVLAQNYPAACQVTPGTAPNGGSCGSSWQCQSTHCEKPTAACGTCSARQPVSGTCTVADGCNVGLVCANSKCVVPGIVGASCDDNNPCRGDLYCSGTGNRTCAMLVEVGGSCADTSKACDVANGAGCNPLTNTCVAVVIAMGGEPCGILNGTLANGTLTLCMEGDACPNLTATNLTSVCASPVADGAACGTAAPGQNCVPPATCQMNLCRLPSDSCQ
jgi:hypothetical protein